MADFVQIQIEMIDQRQPEDIQRELSKALETTLRKFVGDKAFNASDWQVNVEKPIPLAIEPAVTLALIGLSIKLVDLIMFLIKRHDEAKKLDTEKAKRAAEQASKEEKEKWRKEFIEYILLNQVLAQAQVQPVNVVNVVVQIVQERAEDGE